MHRLRSGVGLEEWKGAFDMFLCIWLAGRVDWECRIPTMTRSISWWALFRMVGFLIISANAHSIILDDVSVPAVNKFYMPQKKDHQYLVVCVFVFV